MEKTNIYGFEVEYEKSSESAEKALKFFEEIGESGTKAFFDEAHRDLVNHTCHFKVHDHGSISDRDYHLTLIHKDDGSYHLRKTTGH